MEKEILLYQSLINDLKALIEDARIWYMNEASKEGWSSRTLDRNISTRMQWIPLMNDPAAG